MCHVVFLCGVLSVSGMSDQVSASCVWSFYVVCCLSVVCQCVVCGISVWCVVSVSGELDLDSVMCGLSLWCVSVSGTSDVVSASCACSVC